MMIAGDFTQVNGQTRNRLARLYPDGSLEGAMRIDTAFHEQPPVWAGAIGVQPDGKIVIGTATHVTNGREALVRLQNERLRHLSELKARRHRRSPC